MKAALVILVISVAVLSWCVFWLAGALEILMWRIESLEAKSRAAIERADEEERETK